MKRETFIDNTTREIHNLTDSLYEHLMDDEIDSAFEYINSITSILKEIRSSFTQDI